MTNWDDTVGPTAEKLFGRPVVYGDLTWRDDPDPLGRLLALQQFPPTLRADDIGHRPPGPAPDRWAPPPVGELAELLGFVV